MSQLISICHAALIRDSCKALASQCPRLVWSGVSSRGSAKLSFLPLGVSHIRSSASSAPTSMAAARGSTSRLKIWRTSPPTFCDLNKTASDKCGEVVKVKMCKVLAHGSAADLEPSHARMMMITIMVQSATRIATSLRPHMEKLEKLSNQTTRTELQQLSDQVGP